MQLRAETGLLSFRVLQLLPFGRKISEAWKTDLNILENYTKTLGKAGTHTLKSVIKLKKGEKNRQLF